MRRNSASGCSLDFSLELRSLLKPQLQLQLHRLPYFPLAEYGNLFLSESVYHHPNFVRKEHFRKWNREASGSAEKSQRGVRGIHVRRDTKQRNRPTDLDKYSVLSLRYGQLDFYTERLPLGTDPPVSLFPFAKALRERSVHFSPRALRHSRLRWPLESPWRPSSFAERALFRRCRYAVTHSTSGISAKRAQPSTRTTVQCLPGLPRWLTVSMNLARSLAPSLRDTTQLIRKNSFSLSNDRSQPQIIAVNWDRRAAPRATPRVLQALLETLEAF